MADKSLFVYNYTMRNNADCNDMVTTGLFRSYNASHSPVEGKYAVIEVLAAGQYIIQRWMEISGGTCYTRFTSNGTSWSAWKQQESLK